MSDELQEVRAHVEQLEESIGDLMLGIQTLARCAQAAHSLQDLELVQKSIDGILQHLESFADWIQKAVERQRRRNRGDGQGV